MPSITDLEHDFAMVSSTAADDVDQLQLCGPTGKMLHGEKYGRDDQNCPRATFRYSLVAVAQLSAKRKPDRRKNASPIAVKMMVLTLTVTKSETSGSGTPGSETPIPSESRLTDAHAASRPHPLATLRGASSTE